MDKIQQQLNINKESLKSLLKKIKKIEVSDDNKRNMLLIGFHQNALSHYLAMNILIEQKLYNSAFALVRVFFENIIRARYMYSFLNDSEIIKMYGSSNWDKFFYKKKNKKVELNLGIMCEKLDKKYIENNCIASYADIQKRTYNTMNDYTHTGSNAIARNFNE